MKLYKVGRVDADGTKYDEVDGFVVRAKSPSDARKVAAKDPGNEGSAFWHDKAQSYCLTIGQTDRGLSSRVILRSFKAG